MSSLIIMSLGRKIKVKFNHKVSFFQELNNAAALEQNFSSRFRTSSKQIPKLTKLAPTKVASYFLMHNLI